VRVLVRFRQLIPGKVACSCPCLRSLEKAEDIEVEDIEAEVNRWTLPRLGDLK